MVYSLVRVVIIAILLLILFLVFRKSFAKLQKTKKRYKILIIIIVLLLWSVLQLIPFENCVMSFTSPQEAFEYKYGSNNIKIEKVIEGKESALVFSVEDGNKASYNTFPKEKSGYKLTSSFKFDDTHFKSFGKYSITTCRIGNEKYIIADDVLLTTPTSDMTISDNQHSQFQQFSCKNNDRYEVYNYTIINANLQNYKLCINGKEVTLK